MNRMTCAIAAMVAALTAGTSRGDVVPQILGTPPATYAPGTPFTFTIIVPQISDFSSFNLNLAFTTTVTDPNLSVSGALPASQYVFSDPNLVTSGFMASSPPPVSGSNQVFLNVTDSILPPSSSIVAIPGTNDTLAVVTVSPGADLTGPITVSFDGTDLNYNFEAKVNDSLPGPVTINQGASATPVPTPAAWLTLALGGLILAGRNRLRQTRLLHFFRVDFALFFELCSAK